jgi:hypothetical protein
VTGNFELGVKGNSVVVTRILYGIMIVVPEKIRIGNEDVSVTSIGRGAFEGSLIMSISIPSSVISLDARSFDSCDVLTEVIFLPRSTSLVFGEFAFHARLCLKSFVLPRVTTSIGQGCFCDCSRLVTFEFEHGSLLREIPYSPFSGCVSLLKRSLPDSVAVIGHFTFRRCMKLSSIDISRASSLKTIGPFAFMGCSALKTIFIPISVEQFNGGAFCESDIETVMIDEGNEVSDRGNSMFQSCETNSDSSLDRNCLRILFFPL